MFELLTIDEKARKSRQNGLRDKTPYVWTLDYRWSSFTFVDRRSRCRACFAALPAPHWRTSSTQPQTPELSWALQPWETQAACTWCQFGMCRGMCLNLSVIQLKPLLTTSILKGRVQKKNAAKLWSFTKPGGGVSEGNKKPNPFFGKVFFQWACRIILGPPKHVLHLVWSAYVLSTTIRKALKVARRTRILGKIRPFL